MAKKRTSDIVRLSVKDVRRGAYILGDSSGFAKALREYERRIVAGIETESRHYVSNAPSHSRARAAWAALTYLIMVPVFVAVLADEGYVKAEIRLIRSDDIAKSADILVPPDGVPVFNVSQKIRPFSRLDVRSDGGAHSIQVRRASARANRKLDAFTFPDPIRIHPPHGDRILVGGGQLPFSEYGGDKCRASAGVFDIAGQSIRQRVRIRFEPNLLSVYRLQDQIGSAVETEGFGCNPGRFAGSSGRQCCRNSCYGCGEDSSDQQPVTYPDQLILVANITSLFLRSRGDPLLRHHVLALTLGFASLALCGLGLFLAGWCGQWWQRTLWLLIALCGFLGIGASQTWFVYGEPFTVWWLRPGPGVERQHERPNEASENGITWQSPSPRHWDEATTVAWDSASGTFQTPLAGGGDGAAGVLIVGDPVPRDEPVGNWKRA